METTEEIVREYRILLPMSVEEFRRGQLYSVAKTMLLETGGGEGFEVVVDEPSADEKYGDCQHTHKIIHLASKVPAFIRLLAPKGSLEVHEKAWNAYPNTHTEYSNPDYMKENFYVIIDSRHVSDRGTTENIFGLESTDLKRRHVINIDITDKVAETDYKEEEDPAKYHSEVTGRGPLGENWKTTSKPVMCVYKLVRVKFQWWGLQRKVQNVIIRAIERILMLFFRRSFCWIDKWYEMTMDDIRELEAKTKKELQEARNDGEVSGMSEQ